MPVSVMETTEIEKRGWSGIAKVSCILRHQGVQLIWLHLGKACYPCSSISEMQNNSVSATTGNHTAQLRNFSDFKNEYVSACCETGIGTQIMHVNDKVPKKSTELDETPRASKSILDYFKTPEKEVSTKQKSLLQFFTKTETATNSKTSTTEKENAYVKNGSIVSSKVSSDSDKIIKNAFVAKKKERVTVQSDNTNKSKEIDRKDNTALQESTKKKHKLKKKRGISGRDAESHKIDQNMSVTEEQIQPENELEDSVVIVSDLSSLDESSFEKSVKNKIVQEECMGNEFVSNDDQENICDTVEAKFDTKQKCKKHKQQRKEQEVEETHVGRITSKQVVSNDEIPDLHINRCNENLELLKKDDDQDETGSDKSSPPNTLTRKPALRGKEMMNLLMEIKGTKDGKRSKHKHHKHKHKHKQREEQDKKNSENRNCSAKIGKSKSETKKEETYSHLISTKDELKPPEKIPTIRNKKEKMSSDFEMPVQIESEVPDDIQNQTAADTSKNVAEKLGNDQIDEKLRNGQKKLNEKDDAGREKTIDSLQEMKKHDSTQSCKKKKQKKSKEKNTLKIDIDDSDSKKEENDSCVKSISYKDFLSNLEKEEKHICDKLNVKKEMSYSDYLKSLEQKDTVEEPMEISFNNSNGLESKDSDNARTLKESEVSEVVLSSVSELKCSEKQSETIDDDRSDPVLASKPTGIARFFSVITSTPDKPKKQDAKSQLQMFSPKSTSKIKRKNKFSKKLEEDDKDSSGLTVLSVDSPKQCNIHDETDPKLVQTDTSLKEDVVRRKVTNTDRDMNGESTVDKDSTVKSKGSESYEQEQRRKVEFLNSKGSVVSSGKTTQAVLSFSKSGLTMVKQDSVDSVDNTYNIEVDSVPVKTPLKTNKKSKASKSGTKKINDSQKLSDDSNVFETPKNKVRGRKKKINIEEDHQSESDISYECIQTDDSGDGGRRRSLRKKYKVSVFQMDEEQKTPIKIKLRRCPKSSSSVDEGDIAVTKAKKIKLTAKQSKAQALLEKAKRSKKKKSKEKSDETKVEKMTKEEKKLKKKLKRKPKNESGEEVIEHRRSSRLVGRLMPSMEEVSLENIVILSDDEEEYSGSKTKKKKDKKVEKTVKKKDALQEVSVGKDSPKMKGKRTASPTKPAGKLAPIFMGKGNKSQEVKKPPLDPEQAKQRMQFLMSGVPEELRKQTAKAVAAVVATEYPPIPTVSHVLQIPVSNNCLGSLAGSIDVWQLQRPELNYRHYVDPFCLEPMSRFTGDLINRQMVNVDLSLIKNFREHPIIEGTVEEACVTEVSCYNPSFPVNKLFASLKKLKSAAEQTQEAEVKLPETDPVTVIDDEEPQQKKKGRRSRLKLQKDEKKELKVVEPQIPVENTKKQGNALLWTDKYQPSSSIEVIGNSGSVKKLKNWLSEWKHILDREAKKARKLLMKKNKGKLQKTEVPDDQWDSDSDFDMDSDDSDVEDTLCNTMLLSGPHGCGKTAAVYALAQELGFKVHEVNASSSRNGKKILSQLQEATQSHQVSHQGCGTPSKNSGIQAFSKPQPAAMPTAFTNLFKKKDTTSDSPKPTDDKKSKKRKREANEKEENPKKKRSKKDDYSKKTVKPAFLDIDESSNGMVQGLNLSSTTMILFDEVDLVFDDDKGFLSAVQTFMATTKIPIVMTTNSPVFTAYFDGRYETLTFRQPSMTSLSSYLQLICLLEGLRVDPVTLSELIQVFKCDVRRCLLSLQFISESGGGLAQTFRSVAKSKDVETKQIVPVLEETIESSQDSQHSAQGSQNPTFGDDDDDDFVMLKPRISRQRRLIDEENSNSVEPFAQVFNQKSTERVSADTEEDSKLYPCVHRLGLDLLVGLTLGHVETLHETFLRNMKMPTITNLLETFHICDVCHTFCRNLMYNNHILLLPLATKVTDQVTVSVRQEQSQKKGKKRKRIQTDLYDSEASNDATECPDPTNITEDSSEKEEKDSEASLFQKRENKCSVETLSAFSQFYDTLGMLDVMETQESLRIMNSVKTTFGRRTYGSVEPGLGDNLPKFHNPCELDCEVTRCYSTEVEVRSVTKLYQEVDRIQGEVENLCRNNPAYSEDYILPVLRGTEKFSLSDKNHPSPTSGVKCAEENVIQNLPLIVHSHHGQLQLDYLPTLREISRTEHCRQIANTKRRFHHYFDSITLPLKDTTLNILSSTLS